MRRAMTPPIEVRVVREVVLGPGLVEGYHIVAPSVRCVEPVTVRECVIEHGEDVMVVPR